MLQNHMVEEDLFVLSGMVGANIELEVQWLEKLGTMAIITKI